VGWTKKKPQKGAFPLGAARGSERDYPNPLSFPVKSFVAHDAVNLGKERKVPAHSYVSSWMDACAQLTN
jgi:hypothetical protein